MILGTLFFRAKFCLTNGSKTFRYGPANWSESDFRVHVVWTCPFLKLSSVIFQLHQKCKDSANVFTTKMPTAFNVNMHPFVEGFDNIIEYQW